MSEENLKPCPFCGGKAMLFEDDFYRGDFMVQCCDCGASTEHIIHFHKEDEAIALWNRRVKNEYSD